MQALIQAQIANLQKLKGEGRARKQRKSGGNTFDLGTNYLKDLLWLMHVKFGKKKVKFV